MSDDRYEELARTILEEPPSSWPGELGALRIEPRTMPAALRARLDEITEAETAQTTESISEKEEIQSGSDRNVVSIFSRRKALAAAFSAAVAAGLLVYFGPLIHFPGSVEHSATLAFVKGDVSHNTSAAHTSDKVREGETLSIGEGSLAVLVAKGEGVESRLRIFSGSAMGVDILNNHRFQARLKQGTLLANLSHIASSAENPGTLSIVTSTSEATVVGTLFSDEIGRAGDVTLTTYEGTVSFRRRWDALEDLPEELIKRSEILSGTREVFRTASAGVVAGSSSVIHYADFQQRLSQITDLNQLLSRPEFVALHNRKDVSESEIAAALKLVDETFDTAQKRSQILQQAQVAFGQPPRAKEVTLDELELHRSELETMSVEERENRYNELRNARKDMDHDTFRREVTRVLGKAPQEILLKNGEKIYGTLFGENGRYRVYTATGVRIVDPEEIEQILFE